MDKLRRIFALLLAVCLAAGFCGCSRDPAPPGANTATDPTRFYEEVRDDFLIDAEVAGFPAGSVPKVYQGIIRSFPEEQINAFLAANQDAAVGWNSREDVLTRYNEASTARGGSFYATEGIGAGKMFPEIFAYSLPQSDWWSRYYIYAGQNHYDTSSRFVFAHMFTEPRDFGFATAREAEERVRDAVSKLGFNDLRLNRTLYIDHEILSQITPILKQPEWQPLKGGANITKEDWTEADDGYIFEFFPAIDGVPMVYPTLFFDTYTYCGASILAWYQENGIVYLLINSCPMPEAVAEEPERILPAAQALSTARQKLGSILTHKNTVISKVSAEYFYVHDGSQFLLRPVWVVYAKYTDTQLPEYPARTYIIIDAITGQEY